MSTLENVKNIDQSAKNCIFGYVREIQTLFPDDKTYFTIPTLVIHWILLYYSMIEKFDVQNCGETYRLSEDNTIVTKTETNYPVAYLSKILVPETGIHKWKFKIICVSVYTTIIGIWKTRFALDLFAELWQTRARGKFYGWSATHRCITAGDNRIGKNYGSAIKSEDIIEMIVDLDKYQIRYIHNNEDLGVAFTEIEKTTYRVCMCVYEKGNSVQLLQYENISKCR